MKIMDILWLTSGCIKSTEGVKSTEERMLSVYVVSAIIIQSFQILEFRCAIIHSRDSSKLLCQVVRHDEGEKTSLQMYVSFNAFCCLLAFMSLSFSSLDVLQAALGLLHIIDKTY